MPHRCSNGFAVTKIFALLCLAFFLCLASLLFVRPGHAQAAGGADAAVPPYVGSMTFDVISVRESRPEVGKAMTVGGGFSGGTSSLQFTNYSIANMLASAYGISVHQIQGLPEWTNRAMFNVQAKADEATDRRLATLSQQQVSAERRHMLQALLAERFKFQMHWETREAPVYHLVVAKGGPRLAAAGSMPLSADELKSFGNGKVPALHQRGNGARGYEFIGHSARVTSLIGILGMLMATDVVDNTNLTGAYDFDLQYSQADDAHREVDPTIWPPVADALEQQLGLKLEHAKGTVQVMIVDRLEPPTLN